MEDLLNWLIEAYQQGPRIEQKLIVSILVMLGLWLLYWLTSAAISNRISDKRLRYQWQKIVGYIFFLVGLLVVGRIWFEGFQSLATFLGLLSAGLAIALKDPITNIFGWIFIVWRRPFEVGDRIEINGIAGDVVDVRIFQFSLMEIGNWVDADQSTGRILHVPNQIVFTSSLANFTKGSDYIWNEIPVLLTFESDWKKGKQILQEIGDTYAQEDLEQVEKSFQNASKRFLIEYGKLTPAVYTHVEKSGVLLTIRYLCQPRQRRDSAQTIWEAILHTFAQHDDIQFAYPTQRFYNYQTESKRSPTSIETSG